MFGSRTFSGTPPGRRTEASDSQSRATCLRVARRLRDDESVPAPVSSADLDELLSRIGAAGDEPAVVSVAAEQDSGQWRVVHGSVLLGPLQMAASAWPRWHEDSQRRGGYVPFDRLLERSGGVDAWAVAEQVHDGRRFLRFAIPAAEVRGWLGAIVSGDPAVVSGGRESVFAQVGPPHDLLRVFPGRSSPAGGLAAMAGRPVVGWLHPLSGGTGRPLPDEWPGPDGVVMPGAALFLFGLASVRPDPLPGGLLVGRLERRAWLGALRGGEQLQTFDVVVRFDPSLVSLRELIVDLEETSAGGELLSARSVPLAQTVLPSEAAGADAVTVRLPTVGRRIRREVRLRALDGTLLDAAGPVHLAEAIYIGDRLAAGTAEPVTLRVRLDRLARVDAEHAELLGAGLADRVVVAGADGRRVLADRLTWARGELLVFDPFFGKSRDDWALLDAAGRPCRVLTAATVVGTPGPSCRIRRWTSKVRPPPFHDRAFLWDGGGFTVGTSPNGLGARLSLVDDLAPAAVDALRGHFELWWADPRFFDAP